MTTKRLKKALKVVLTGLLVACDAFLSAVWILPVFCVCRHQMSFLWKAFFTLLVLKRGLCCRLPQPYLKLFLAFKVSLARI